MAKPLFKFRKLWFDDKRVRRMMSRKERKTLNRYGGAVRKHAQYSMKTRKGSSPPGEPPYAHDKKLLKRLLFYAYDPTAKSVVVGPVLLKATQELHVPRTLEHGGDQVMVEHGKIVVRHYEPRHYMKQASAPYVGRIAQWYAEA